MKMNRRKFNSGALGLIAASALPVLARAQGWPAKPITCVIGYAAGGGVDYILRAITPGLTRQLGQTVIVENKPGASGTIAATTVARSASDGYTIFGTDGGVPVLNSVLYSKLPYDASRDFAPVSLIARVPMLIVANPSLPVADLRGLVELSKRTSLSYASPGKGSYHHLAMELVKRRAGFQASDIAYKGAAPAVQDVLAGHVQIMPLDAIVAIPYLRAAKLKALAVLNATRLVQLPEIPTAAEQGITETEAVAWTGIMAPKNTPGDILSRLSIETVKAVRSPEVHKRFTDLGMDVVGNTPEEFEAFLTAEKQRWHPLIKALNLKLD